jgi:hypothetical protein
LPFVVFGSVYAASAVGVTAGQAAFTLFAVVLFCILLPQQRQAGLLRLEDILIGGAVSLALRSLLRPWGGWVGGSPVQHRRGSNSAPMTTGRHPGA